MDVYSFSLLNDIAEPSFIVDQDATVIWRSDSASELFRQDIFAQSEIIANLFRCLHIRFLATPCSSAPFCQHCVARNLVRRCLREKSPVSQKAILSIADDEPFSVESTIVADPIGDGDCKLVIVTMLNARRLVAGTVLHRHCPACKVDGSDSQHWLHVENYLHGVEYVSEAAIASAQEQLPAYHADLTHCHR